LPLVGIDSARRWAKDFAHHAAPLIFTPLLLACATGDGVTSDVPRAASTDSRGIASRGRHVRIVCFFRVLVAKAD
jgi:hypothetical protein